MCDLQSQHRQLVLGGARSGKSRYAEDLILRSGLECIYIATSHVFDEEMRDRVEKHKTQRGDSWTTIEEPYDLVGALKGSLVPNRAVLVDCLTLWLTNIMLADRDVEAESAAFAEFVETIETPVVFVSNEVGLGIVPDNKLGRIFRDAQGRLNQQIAQKVDRVVFVAAGLPLQLKPQ